MRKSKNILDYKLKIWGNWKRNCFKGLGYPDKAVFVDGFKSRSSKKPGITIASNEIAEEIDVIVNELFDKRHISYSILNAHYYRDMQIKDIAVFLGITYYEARKHLEYARERVEHNL